MAIKGIELCSRLWLISVVKFYDTSWLYAQHGEFVYKADKWLAFFT
jgi:hypothetical protein